MHCRKSLLISDEETDFCCLNFGDADFQYLNFGDINVWYPSEHGSIVDIYQYRARLLAILHKYTNI